MNVYLSRLAKAAAAWLPLLSAAFLGAAVSPSALAQAPVPTGPPPIPGATELPSQINPFPNAMGDAQNRGRGANDDYWGILDSNFLWNFTPYSRIPDQTPQATVGLSGWAYPFPIDNNPSDGAAYRRFINLYGDSLTKYVTPGLTMDDAPLVNVPPPATVTLTSTGTYNGTAYDTGNTPQSVWEAGATFTPNPPLPVGIVNTPSQNALAQNTQPANYHRTVAVQRPAGTAVNYFFDQVLGDNPAKSQRLFVWFPVVPGTSRQFTRYAIRVILPNINGTDTTDPATENRIDDARYLVHYHITLSDGTIVPRNKICFVGQDTDASSSTKYLSDTPGGTPAYFPFYSEATHNDTTITPAVDRDYVALDNTTTDDITTVTRYVLADGLSFEQRVAVIRAAPTLSPLGPGRKMDTVNTPGQQPAAGPNYTVGYTATQLAANPPSLLITNSPTTPTASIDRNGAGGTPTGLIMPDASFGFANTDPRDPDYSDPTSPLNGKFDTNNPAVLFEGPEAFVRPKIMPTEYGSPYGSALAGNVGTYEGIPQPALPGNITNPNTANILPIAPTAAPPANDSGGTRLQFDPAFPGDTTHGILIQRVSANNFEIYRRDMSQATGGTVAADYDLTNTAGNRPVPIYSQMQVLVARTVYVPDPETNVPDSQKDGTKVIEVGEVLALDWQTGAVIWRFPDRTYLPPTMIRNNRGVLTPLAGYQEPVTKNGFVPQSTLRNKFIGTENVNGVDLPVFQVQGIVAYDLNGDGLIEDNEVFIGPHGNNASGGLSAAITIAGRIPVQGQVTIPLYNKDQSISTNNDNSPIIGVTPAPPGRYADKTTGAAVPVTVAYVASQNGVLYAIDAHGNNDSIYRESAYDATANPRGAQRIGTFYPGTSNVLWTFSALSVPRVISGNAAVNETLEKYHRRVKGEVPATAGFGNSAPTIAYRFDDADIAATGPIIPEGLPNPNPAGRNDQALGQDEPRLFVGNQNGNLYALDATALGGITAGTPNPLPFHKGEQPTFLPFADTTFSANHKTDLRWWFETEPSGDSGGGAINGTPAVSITRLNAGTGANNPFNTGGGSASANSEKGVYITSAAGRIYCLDWTGPIRKDDAGHVVGNPGAPGLEPNGDQRVWNGTAGNINAPAGGAQPNSPANDGPSAGAATFNDNTRFHNQFAATTLATPDLTEGTIRPRWVYPSQYLDITGDYKADRYTAGGLAAGATGVQGNLVRDTPLSPLLGAVSLVDFVWYDPKVLDANNRPTATVRHYVAVAGNDRTDGVTPPTTGKLYLLDQAGDRGSFQTNPRVTNTTGKGLVYSSPVDQFALKIGPVGNAAPAWTYRYQYGTYDTAGNLIIQGANNGLSGDPTVNPNLSLNHPTPYPNTTGTANDANTEVTQGIQLGQPSRRLMPTIFFGGVGRVWAVDIDAATGVFTRWRAAGQPQPIPLPLDKTGPNGIHTGIVPTSNENIAFMLPWQNPDLVNAPAPAGNLYARPIIARTMPLPSSDPSSVDGSLTITGGPLQTRDSNFNLPASITSQPVQPVVGSPMLPANPYDLKTITVANNPVQVAFTPPTNDAPVLEPPGVGYDQQYAAPTTAQQMDRADPMGRYVNQEIDDPLATTRGTHFTYTAVYPTVPDPVADVSFQYPALFITTAGSATGNAPITAGGLYEYSTNIEGEDTSTWFNGIFTDPSHTQEFFQTSSLGWALNNDLQRFGKFGHVAQLSVSGPGGTGSGVSIMTPAYFPGLDPNFKTNKIETYPADDVTYPSYPLYPDYEPGVEALDPTVYPGTIQLNPERTAKGAADTNVNKKRSGGVLHPRGYFTGDTTAAPNAVVVLPPDNYTGDSGLPLDANGLYFDKRFALRDHATPAQDPAEPYSVIRWRWGGPNDFKIGVTPPTLETNDDGQIALPAWSGMTAAQDDTPNDPFLDLASQVPNNLPDGIRPRFLSATAALTDPVANNDDVNPTAENAVWIFSGGPDGVLYAYTPALPRAFGGDGGSGLAAGTPVTTGVNIENPPAKFDIFPAQYVLGTIIPNNGGTRPDRAQSVLGTGGKNFYEWGETVYIVAWDFAVGPATYKDPQPPFTANPPQSLTIQIKSINGVTPAISIPLTATTDPNSVNRVLTGKYPFDPGYFPGATLPTNVSQGPPLGVAVFQYRLDNSHPQPPGAILDVSISPDATNQVVNSQTGSRTITATLAGGANDADILQNSDVPFMIANPLAAAAFVTDTQSNIAQLNVGNQFTQDTIGPFEDTAAAKNKVAAKSTDGTPDNVNYYYSQALSNGNLIQRYDLTAYSTGATQPNQSVGQKLTDGGGQSEPDYYVPIVVDAGYGSHGGKAVTDAVSSLAATQGQTRRYLRIVNRSLLPNLTKLRAQVLDDMIWRTWPGNQPNDDATDGNVDPVTNIPTSPGGSNQRLTPVGAGNIYAMRADGIINFLPWEQPVPEVQPWKNATSGNTLGAGGNSSQDYPDIIAHSQGSVSPVIGATSASGDMTKGPGSLPALVNKQTVGGTLVPVSNGTVTDPTLLNPLATNEGSQGVRQYGVTLSVNVPKYQPANLVAMHSLTSTYLASNTLNDGGLGTGNNPGPVQLPLGNGTTTSDQNHRLTVNGGNVVAPFGYTTRVRIFYDQSGDGKWEAGEAYRDVELWMGVSVDMGLESVKSPIEVSGPNGPVAMGFGLQNGFLGYNIGTAPFSQAFLPFPLYNPGSGITAAPYQGFFKTFTIQNHGNVNLWNLRASQRGTNKPTPANSKDFGLYLLRSTTVDPVQGIMARGMDPSGNLGNSFPNIVTSLDDNLDAIWDAYLSAKYSSIQAVTGADVYTSYFKNFVGKHTLHKARVGSTVNTTLSIPDVPSAQALTANSAGLTPDVPVLSVAVPIGTPAGTYGPPDTAPADFYVFEDHDTDSVNLYRSAPIGSGTGTTTAVSIAGPLYGGTDLTYPSNVGILPANGAGIFRPQTLPAGASTTSNASDYLPHTDPGIRLKVTVGEGALTGQIADQALPINGTTNVATGILPFVDVQPLVDASNAAMGDRPAAALSPAAYRSFDGSLHFFFSRNSNATDANGTTMPNSPYNLFHSTLAWDANTGQWASATAASPTGQSFPPSNPGQWFSTPAAITAGVAPGTESNTSPFVLQPSDPTNGAISTGATLFFLNTIPVAGGQPLRSIFYAPLTSNNGVLTVGTPQPYLNTPDASLQRYSPRAIYLPNGTDLLFYYGGTASKWSLYFSPRTADTNGTPTGTAPQGSGVTGRSEFQLSLPLSITSAADPVPIYRQIYTGTGAGAIGNFIDLYYTGVARTDQTSNLYMTRYQISGQGTGARLVPIPLSRHNKEQLAKVPGSPVFRSRDIAWVRDTTNTANLPVIYVPDPNTGNPVPITIAANWVYDDTTNLLVQKVPITVGANTEALYVYADTSGGTVRFRGSVNALAQIKAAYADYTPQTYRITADGVPNSSAFGFFDDRLVPPSQTVQAQVQQTGSPTNYIIARPSTMEVGRTWLFWRQAANGKSPASLQHVTRRVGVDLKALGVLSNSTTQPDSIKLSHDVNGNQSQFPVQDNNDTPISVAIDGTATQQYEVDVANGRIYVDPKFEGHKITLTFAKVNSATPDTTQKIGPIDETITQVEDIDPTQPSTTFNGKGVTLQHPINEGQPYAFLDKYAYDSTGTAMVDPNTVSALNGSRSAVLQPQANYDPTIQPGKVWLFWTSPRARSGVLRNGNGLYPFSYTDTNGATHPAPVNGYDVYWQTMAPWFDYDSFYPTR